MCYCAHTYIYIGLYVCIYIHDCLCIYMIVYVYICVCVYYAASNISHSCFFPIVDLSPSTLKSLASNVRMSCGFGLHFRLSWAQIELNYAVPIKAHFNDQ